MKIKRSISVITVVALAVMLVQNLTLAQYLQLNLAGFADGVGRYTDSRLDGWGMVQAPDGLFIMSDTAFGVATFYNRSGKPLPQTITIPSASGSGQGVPSGLVYNSTSDFVISKNGKSAPAKLIFSTLDGALCGWNPAVDRDNAVLMFSGLNAGYPGLALGKNSRGQNVLYAANWGSNPSFVNVGFDMFDGGFNPIGSFGDPSVAVEFAAFGQFPFGVDYEDGKVFVTYGLANAIPTFGGVVDIFDGDGNLLTPNHFAANAPDAGPLANPWAFVMAPANFGKFSNALLIGNVEGPGYINAFDPNTGALLGQLTHSNGEPIAIAGLWEMIFPKDSPGNGKSNPLFFNAGPNAFVDPGNGLFGVIYADPD